MIVVKPVGGLASQLHKYSVGRALAEQLGTELLLDISAYVGPRQRERVFKFELENLSIKARIATEHEIAKAKGLPNELAFRIAETIARLTNSQRSEFLEKNARRLFGHTLYKADITKSRTEDFFEKINPKKNAYIYGEWGMGSALFEGAREKLLEEFVPRNLSSPAIRTSEEIAGTETAVSLHVRRGDYVSDPKTAQFHGACPTTYYAQAISHILKDKPNSRFFVFSDDLQWTREALAPHLPEDTRYVENLKNYEDFHLLSRCHHNIISNSGFSALSAWANEHQDKVVISPRRWVNNEKINDMQISQLPKNWVYL